MGDDVQTQPATPPLPDAGLENLINPQGQVIQMDKGLSSLALQNGYQVATPENIQNVANQKQYGEGTLNKVETALLGAGKTSTFGLSSYLLDKTGIVPGEKQKLLEKYNPISDVVGEVGGVLGSSLLPGGGLVGGVSKLGNAITEGTANIAGRGIAALTDIVPQADKVLNFASQVGSKALGSAVEGALYGGVGNTISEAALGDPDLNAEKIMSNFGYGALIGGALGGAFKVGEKAIPPAWNGAKSALGKLYNFAIGAPGEEPGVLSKAFAKTSSAISGKSAEDILSGIKNRAANSGTEEALGDLGSKLSDNMTELRNQANDALSKTVDDVRPHEISKLLEGIPLEKTAPVADQAAAVLQNSIAKMIAEPAVYGSGSVSKMQQLLDGFMEQATKDSGGIETSADLFNSMNKLKTQVENMRIGGGDAASEYQDVSRSLGGLLKNPDTWGAAATRQSAFSDAQKAFQNAQEPFNKLFVSKITDEVDPQKMKGFLSNIQSPANQIRNTVFTRYVDSTQGLLDEIKNSYENAPHPGLNPDAVNDLLAKHSSLMSDVANTTAASEAQAALNTGHSSGLTHIGELGALVHMPHLVPVIEAGKMIANPGMAISRLAHMEKVVNSVTSAIERGSKGLLTAGSSALDATEGLISQKLSYEKIAANHMEFVDNLNKSLSNPESFIDHVTGATHPIYQAAPKTADALNMAAMRAANFLQSKLPPSDAPVGPFDVKQKPSEAEITMFDRYKNIVENPLDVMNQVKTNTLTPQAVETLSTVYPKLYDHIKEHVMDSLSSMKEPSEIPYQTKLSLSMLMGEPFDKSLSSENIATNAALYHLENVQNQAQQKPKRTKTSALGKMTLANRSQTSFQQAATRQS